MKLVADIPPVTTSNHNDGIRIRSGGAAAVVSSGGLVGEPLMAKHLTFCKL